MTRKLWILGAADPEMAAIEALLRECGERFAYALDVRGERVRPGNAYDAVRPAIADGEIDTVVAVECSGPWSTTECMRADHHRPGDPGYGRPPSEFLPASSLGQVIAYLARTGSLPLPTGEPRRGGISSSIQDDGWDRGMPTAPRRWERGPLHASGPCPGDWILRGYRGHWTIATTAIPAVDRPSDHDLPVEGHYQSVTIPTDLVLTAAADHCLGAAYRDECPGVDPDELARWRAESRAAFQGRPVSELLSDIDATRYALARAPRIQVDVHTHTEDHDWSRSVCDGCARELAEPLADMRRETPWPELPEAATREGVGYMSGPLVCHDGRSKYTCSGSPAQVRAWMSWAHDHGDLVDMYGDPERGFAGGYGHD